MFVEGQSCSSRGMQDEINNNVQSEDELGCLAVRLAGWWQSVFVYGQGWDPGVTPLVKGIKIIDFSRIAGIYLQ